MTNYNVIVTERALAHIDGIYSYIAFELESPLNALRQIERIKEKIYSLDTLPKRCRIFSRKLYRGRDLRRLLVDNYSIYYYIDDTDVVITNVLYSHSLLRNHLS